MLSDSAEHSLRNPMGTFPGLMPLLRSKLYAREQIDPAQHTMERILAYLVSSVDPFPEGSFVLAVFERGPPGGSPVALPWLPRGRCWMEATAVGFEAERPFFMQSLGIDVPCS